MRFPCTILVPAALALLCHTASAQKDSIRTSRAWVAPVAVLAAAAMDPEAREVALREHSHSLDRVVRAVNPFGTAQRLVPALAITYAGALLARNTRLQRATLITAAAYVASDLVEASLKPI